MKTTRMMLVAVVVAALVSLTGAKSAEAQVRISTPGFGFATGSGGTGLRVGGLRVGTGGGGFGVSVGQSRGFGQPSFRPSFGPSFRPSFGPSYGPSYPSHYGHHHHHHHGGFRQPSFGPRWP